MNSERTIKNIKWGSKTKRPRGSEKETGSDKCCKTLVWDEEMRARIYNFDFSFDGGRGIYDTHMGPEGIVASTKEGETQQ